MLCEECKDKTATVHLTKIINNEKMERHLCEDCAAKEHQINFGMSSDFSVHQFLSNLLNYDHPIGKLALPFKPKEQCKTCSLTYDELVHGGKIGCQDCYDTFKTQIDNLLQRIHGTAEHTGKMPKRTGAKYLLQKELQQLRTLLAEHVRREEFEAAAQMRDKIKALEKESEA